MSVLNKRQLREMILREMHENGEHQCFGGDSVPFGSNECVADIELRIDDATHQRNGCVKRTDSRDYYNGLLKVLRRDLRAANKENVIMHPVAEEEPGAEISDEELEELIINEL